MWLYGSDTSQRLYSKKLIFNRIRKLAQQLYSQGKILKPLTVPDNEIGIFTKAYNESLFVQQHQAKELYQSRRHIDTITHEIPILLASFDRNTQLAFINKRFLTWIGKEEACVNHLSIDQILKNHIHTDLSPFYQRVLNGIQCYFESDFLDQTK